ncbi:MAG: zinc finger MYND domain-containing protein, partial [Nitrosomonadaceae bacterium]|nr:zinc finger MYND domain-containing protein [Nitrosomonadaceae bacterium]
CGGPGRLAWCTCRAAAYCSAGCQKSDWRAHKMFHWDLPAAAASAHPGQLPPGDAPLYKAALQVARAFAHKALAAGAHPLAGAASALLRALAARLDYLRAQLIVDRGDGGIPVDLPHVDVNVRVYVDQTPQIEILRNGFIELYRAAFVEGAHCVAQGPPDDIRAWALQLPA